MKSFYLVILFFITSTSVICAQSSFVAGGESVGKEVNVSFSVGQPVAGYASDANSSVNIGVQQVYENIIASSNDYQSSKFSLSVYPNPFTDIIDVTVSEIDAPTKVLIFDTKGVLVGNYELSSSPLTLNLSFLPEGVYYLALVDKDMKLLSNVKIVKRF